MSVLYDWRYVIGAWVRTSPAFYGFTEELSWPSPQYQRAHKAVEDVLIVPKGNPIEPHRLARIADEMVAEIELQRGRRGDLTPELEEAWERCQEALAEAKRRVDQVHPDLEPRISMP